MTDKLDINYLTAGSGSHEVAFVFNGTCKGDRNLAQQIIALLLPSAGDDGFRQYGGGVFVSTLGSNFNVDNLRLYIVQALADIKNIIKIKSPSSELLNLTLISVTMAGADAADILIKAETKTTTTNLSFPLVKTQEAS